MTTLFQSGQNTERIKPVVNAQTNKYTQRDVADHSDVTSCWIIVYDKVYDVTKFLSEHPGGYDVLLEHAGRDATIPFEEKGHSRVALQLLHDYYIGDVAKKMKDSL